MRYKWSQIAALALASLLGLLVSNTAFAQSIQKWTDQNGKVHYGSAPPKGAQLLKLQSSVSIVDASASAGPEVVLYSTSWCGYCRKSRAYMRQNGIAFSDYDIEKNSIAKAEHQRLGGKGVPFLVRGEDILRGFAASSYQRFFSQ